MADITKKIFIEMLECVDDPSIHTRSLGAFWQATCYEDVLLYFSGSDLKAVDCTTYDMNPLYADGKE